MFGISGIEFFLVLLFGFLVFGPDKLPAIAKTIGKAIGKFRSAQEEMNKVIKTEVYDPTSDEPFKNPLDALSKISEVGKKDEEKTESFSERKAKYDKERAAKKAAEEKKAAAGTTTAAAGAAVAAKKATDGAKADEKPKPSADELYGNKPAAAKKTATSTAAKADAKADGTESVAKKPAARAAAAKPTACWMPAPPPRKKLACA